MRKILFTFLLLLAILTDCFAQDTEVKLKEVKAKSEQIFVVVEEMPIFKGGDVNTFRKWVQERVRYPDELIAQKVEGKVYIMFVVEPDGSVTNVKIMRGLNPLLDEDSIKVVESAPKWKPGMQREVPVRVRFSITIEYNLI